ncbi:MAG: hypothetical protein J1F28_08885 [Oscillospiraceae bacterium]|nr:hypothetical protein [Oscillospiraceae bacterium]
MEDMKKMIERYKKELLEYSKAGSPKESGEKNISAVPGQQSASSDVISTEEPSPESGRKKPSVIGYISEDAQKELGKINVPDEILESVRSENTDAAVDPSEDEESVTYVFPAEQTELSDNTADTSDDSEMSGEAAAETSDDARKTQREETFDRLMFGEIPSFEETREEITEQSVPDENVHTENSSGITNNSGTASRAEFGDNETVSNEKAERLTELPISGQSPDEQLTGRNFEDNRMPQNDPIDVMRPNGSQTGPIDFTDTVSNSVEEFEKNNRGAGTLMFRIFTANEALPVENAVCTVTKVFNGKQHIFYTLLTDESGRTTAVLLPAPSRELSQDPDNRIRPYAAYDAVVSHKGFADVVFRDIPIFDGVNSIQQVGMVPVPRTYPENGGEADA